MTVVAAIADRRRVWMAADTAVHTSDLQQGAVRKVRRVRTLGGGEVLLAVTGAAGLMRVARQVLEGPAAERCQDPAAYGADLDDWAEDLASAFTSAAAGMTPPLVEPDRDGMTTVSGSWLLGYGGRLWHLHTHSAVPVDDGVAAIGVGAGVALGWMLALRTGDPGQVVCGAVLAASGRVPYCAAPGGPAVEVLDPPARPSG